MELNCPVCGSNQTNTYRIKGGYYLVECVNCDRETTVDCSVEELAERIDRLTHA